METIFYYYETPIPKLLFIVMECLLKKLFFYCNKMTISETIFYCYETPIPDGKTIFYYYVIPILKIILYCYRTHIPERYNIKRII